MSFQTTIVARIGREEELVALRDGRKHRSVQYKPKKGKGSYKRSAARKIEDHR
jgi:stalled ribosome alternative rescue factor ArfA